MYLLKFHSNLMFLQKNLKIQLIIGIITKIEINNEKKDIC